MKLFYGVLLTIVAQVIAFFQLQSQSRFIWAKENAFILMFLGLPISFLYIKSTGLINEYTGQTWPGRLIGQSIGVIIFSLLSWLVFKEQMTLKTMVCVCLSLTVILIQIFWK
jgi:multidrug transporter EmrE-like cation transporter